jgi:PleD family two-component response regulator
VEKVLLVICSGLPPACFKSLHDINQKTIKGTVSIGVADSLRVSYDFKGLLAAADSTLYMAKNKGRNRVMSYTDITRDSL